MQLGELGVQIVLKSKRAFEALNYIGYELSETKEYYIKRITRDKKAREEYLFFGKQNQPINGMFIMDIIRKGLKNGDKIL